MRWIVLSMKWPELARWIQERHDPLDYQDETLTYDDLLIYKRFKEFEDITSDCITYNTNASKVWEEGIESLLKLKSEESPWIIDERLRNFFENEIKNYNQKRDYLLQ